MEAGHKVTVEEFQSNYVTLYRCCGKLGQIFRHSETNFFSSLSPKKYSIWFVPHKEVLLYNFGILNVFFSLFLLFLSPSHYNK